MKNIITIVFILTANICLSQNKLEFNQVLLISDTEMSVPEGKVWKVTSISGADFYNNYCVINNSDFDWLGLKCNIVFTYAYDNQSVSINFFLSSIVVNGITLINEISGMPSSVTTKYSTDCTGSNYYSSQSFTCANRATNPNLLPMWLPENTTIKTGGPATIASVIEFNLTQ